MYYSLFVRHLDGYWYYHRESYNNYNEAQQKKVEALSWEPDREIIIFTHEIPLPDMPLCTKNGIDFCTAQGGKPLFELHQDIKWKDNNSSASETEKEVAKLSTQPEVINRNGKTLRCVKSLLLGIGPGETISICQDKFNYGSIRTVASRLGRVCGAWFKIKRNNGQIIIKRIEDEK